MPPPWFPKAPSLPRVPFSGTVTIAKHDNAGTFVFSAAERGKYTLEQSAWEHRLLEVIPEAEVGLYCFASRRSIL